ncbi:MAG: hypothetical protein AAF899_05470 [Pseudomonadota bacterium]
MRAFFFAGLLTASVLHVGSADAVVLAPPGTPAYLACLNDQRCEAGLIPDPLRQDPATRVPATNGPDGAEKSADDNAAAAVEIRMASNDSVVLRDFELNNSDLKSVVNAMVFDLFFSADEEARRNDVEALGFDLETADPVSVSIGAFADGTTGVVALGDEISGSAGSSQNDLALIDRRAAFGGADFVDASGVDGLMGSAAAASMILRPDAAPRPVVSINSAVISTTAAGSALDVLDNWPMPGLLSIILAGVVGLSLLERRRIGENSRAGRFYQNAEAQV